MAKAISGKFHSVLYRQLEMIFIFKISHYNMTNVCVSKKKKVKFKEKLGKTITK